MFAFLTAAMQAPGRHRAFRRLAIVHFFMCSFFVYWSATYADDVKTMELVGNVAFAFGLIEGSILIGWRLAQLPKSQALEFLLVSPVRPRRLFAWEALVGISRFLLVQLAGTPAWVFAVQSGAIDFMDLFPLVVMPAIWGIVVGLLLTMWVYESITVRRFGEIIGLGLVLLYLVVGLLIGENIRDVLIKLPTWLGTSLLETLVALHEGNPFGVIQYWLSRGSFPEVAMERFVILHIVTLPILAIVAIRAACRLQPHFQDRHYAQQNSDRPAESDRIGDRPLSWWAVRRVMEYSGRVNLWLAVGVSFLYSAFVIAGDQWPPQLGRMVFTIFDSWGGPAGVATMLAILACVPAVFQYGLWDATTQDRCKRLELLLLSDLTGRDYAHAAFAAAWARGRGYWIGSAALWLSLGISGRNSWAEVVATVLGAALLWALSFAIGFRSFAKGHQSSGIASLFTLGIPCLLAVLGATNHGDIGSLLPPGWCYSPLKTGITIYWLIGMSLGLVITTTLLRRNLRDCVRDLQRWYDRNHGQRSVE